MPPEPGSLVHAEQAREALFASLAPWLDRVAAQLPAEAARLRPLVAVQIAPVMGRLLLVGEGQAVEVARATDEDLPGAAAVADAAETFIAAGLSAMPAGATESAFYYAARPGGGFVVLLDPMTGSARCVFAPRRVGAERWIELFAIGPEGAEVTH